MSLPKQDGYRAFSLTWLASILIYWNKRSIYMRKEFHSQRIFWVHQNGHRFIVLEHQYGCRDVMWKRSIGPPSSYTTTSDHVTELGSPSDERAKYICWEKPVGCGQTLQETFELVLSFQDAFLSSVFSLKFECNNYCVNFKIAFSTISPSLKNRIATQVRHQN